MTTLLESITSRLGGRDSAPSRPTGTRGAMTTAAGPSRSAGGRPVRQPRTLPFQPPHTAAPSPHRRLRARTRRPHLRSGPSPGRAAGAAGVRGRGGARSSDSGCRTGPQPEPMFAEPEAVLPEPVSPECGPTSTDTPEPVKRSKRSAKPAVPAWEDVLLGFVPAASADQRLAAQASSPIQPTATPTPAPSTNHRLTGTRRHPQSVGANPPTAMRFSATAMIGSLASCRGSGRRSPRP